jgi:hypothetical protein
MKIETCENANERLEHKNPEHIKSIFAQQEEYTSDLQF